MFFETNNNNTIHIIKEEGEDFPAHLHNGIEIMICANGTLNVTCNQETRLLNKGEAMIAFPNDIHSYVKTDYGEGILIIFPPNISPIVTSVINSGAYSNFPRNNKVLPIAEELCMLNGSRADFSVIYGYIHVLFGLLTEKLAKPKNKIDVNTFNKAIAYISSNYTSQLTLKKLSSAVGVSEEHLSRMFSAKIEGGFKNYLQLLRVENAKNLLRTTDKSIYEILLESGFSDQSTFNRVFKIMTDMTPKEYRKTFKITSC